MRIPFIANVITDSYNFYCRRVLLELELELRSFHIKVAQVCQQLFYKLATV